MNNKGQALIESIMIMTIISLCSFKFFELGLNLYHEILLDELVEQSLICQLQIRSDCKNILYYKLQKLNFKNTSIQLINSEDTSYLKLQTEFGSKTKISKESQLHLDLSNP